MSETSDIAYDGSRVVSLPSNVYIRIPGTDIEILHEQHQTIQIRYRTADVVIPYRLPPGTPTVPISRK